MERDDVAGKAFPMQNEKLRAKNSGNSLRDTDDMHLKTGKRIRSKYRQ